MIRCKQCGNLVERLVIRIEVIARFEPFLLADSALLCSATCASLYVAAEAKKDEATKTGAFAV